MSTLHLSDKDIFKMDKIQRLNLINALPGFKSANLIGTISESGIHNVAIFSSVIHMGSNPPLLGFLSRPAGEVHRHTLENIGNNGSYTINHVHDGMVKQSHGTSAKYPGDVSEFEVTGLTPKYIDGFPAPYVAESRIQIGMACIEKYEIKANQTVLIVGQIKHMYVPEQLMAEDGFLDLSAAGTVCINGLDAYLGTAWLARYQYARPWQEVIESPVPKKS